MEKWFQDYLVPHISTKFDNISALLEDAAVFGRDFKFEGEKLVEGTLHNWLAYRKNSNNWYSC